MYIQRPHQIKDDILKNKSVFFYSLPGTGKTEFIKNEILDNTVLYIDFSNAYTLKDLSYSLIKSADEFFNKQAQFTTKINDINLFKIALLYPIYESEMRLFNLTFCFDNFNYIMNLDNKENEILKVLAEVFIKSDVNTIFTLNQLSSKDLFISPNSYLYRFSNEVIYSPLNDDDIHSSINEELKKYKLRITKKSCSNIAKELNYNPNFINLFLEQIITSRVNDIDESLILKCIEEVYKSQKYNMKLELLMLIGKKNISDILFYIAAEMNVYQEAIDKNNMQKSNVKKALNALEEVGLIIQESSYKKYICRDKLLKRYILEKFTKGV